MKDFVSAADFERRVAWIWDDVKDIQFGSAFKSDVAKNEYIALVNDILISLGYDSGVNAYKALQERLDNE